MRTKRPIELLTYLHAKCCLRSNRVTHNPTSSFVVWKHQTCHGGFQTFAKRFTTFTRENVHK